MSCAKTLDAKEWKLRALTDIWTGNEERRGDLFIPTGLMGSLRWWFEVLVRGLGGKACDPTQEGVRCPAEGKQHREQGHRCVVCELFGCTGWSRKFRLLVVDENGFFIQRQIRAGQTFSLRFIPLRPVQDEEWCLLNATLRLIADYGAIGGKTTLKPSDEPGRKGVKHHKDYGLVRIEEGPELRCCDRETVRVYVSKSLWRTDFEDGSFSWATLKNFWYVKGRYLARLSSSKSTFNKVIGRCESKDKSKDLCHNNHANQWLAGKIGESKKDKIGESKKVFSFASPNEGIRTFGFVKPDLVDFREIRQRLLKVWHGFTPDKEFQTGGQLLEKLF
jgi:CRISPR-associated protein Cmr1